MSGKLKVLLPLIFLFLSSSIYGQKQIWEIYTSDDQPYTHVVLDRLSADTLFVKSLGNTYTLNIDSIKTLRRERKSYAGIGFFGGMITGGFLMNRYAKNTAESGPILDMRDLSILLSTGLGIILGGIVGFSFGSALGNDEYYDFTKIKKLDSKIRILKRAIEKS